ncbi:hypothetical protein CgunFtcFv8_004882 [Champsocephalus gunnari]|uniref:Uncharacterized protein n=1 Tax=Champsocephalus gunnari TaxID=52237 RepID=A0AAN8E4L4_CHAGU|nr:hypothetical protein CgunFtcFv8_004882 [Champsocephalus gunnari]
MVLEQQTDPERRCSEGFNLELKMKVNQELWLSRRIFTKTFDPVLHSGLPRYEPRPSPSPVSLKGVQCSDDPKACRKRWVFNCPLNISIEAEVFIIWGSLFQSLGATASKARPP